MELCEKHQTVVEEHGVCDLCVLESLSRQHREYVKKHFPGVMVPPPAEFKSIREIMLSDRPFHAGTVEAALPTDKKTGAKLWFYLGIEDGEHVYTVGAFPDGLRIRIRSSVHTDGHSATGEDSIRCWLETLVGDPVAPKVTRWVTRVRGWQTRMSDTLRYLYKLSSYITLCPTCLTWKKAKRVKKTGPNKGRVFTSCECVKSFTWLPDEFTKVPK